MTLRDNDYCSLTIPQKEKFWITAGWYGLAILWSMVLAAWFLDLAHNPLTRVLGWSGDFLLHMTFARATVDHGWFLLNPDLGAPFGMQTYDFPMPEAAQYLLIKIIAWVFPHTESPIGIFYFASFPLTATTALFLLRRCGISAWVALLGALLYTFLPFHFMRLGHVMLASYWVVPLGCWLALTIAGGESVFLAPSATRRLARAQHTRLGWLGLVVVCLLLGSTGAYYTFFTCFFIAMAAPVGAVRQKHLAPLLDGLAVSAAIALVMMLNLAPNMGYHFRHGPNSSVANRGAAESEMYGLKLTQLLLPRPENRVPALAALGHKLDNRPLTNENITAALGLSMGAGFLVLVGSIGFIMLGVKFSRLFVSLCILNLTGVLFATMAGLGAIWAIVYPQVRALNRISVFIAVFAVVALALLLEKFYPWLQRRGGNVVALALTAILLGLALLEQVAPAYRLDQAATRLAYEQDAAFVGQIEQLLPAGAMVFQLPHLNFPENGAVYREPDYDPLRYYLVAHQLRFSYGAMKGRSDGYWMKWISDLPTEQMLVHLAVAGYQGILVNKSGYPDAHNLAQEIEAGLKQAPLSGPRGDVLFFDLRPLAARLENKLGAGALAQARRELLAVTFHAAPKTKWRGGFFKESPEGSGESYSMGNTGTLVLTNPNPMAITVHLRAGLEPALEAGGKLVVAGVAKESVAVRPRIGELGSVGVDWVLMLPPGKSELTFSYDGQGVQPANLEQPAYCLRVIKPVVVEVPELAKMPGLMP